MTFTPVIIYAVQNGQLVRWTGDPFPSPGPGPAPTAPTVPTAVTVAAPTATSATISWQPPASDGGSAITGYTVSRTGGSPVTVAATARSYVFGGLAASTSYTLSVAAVNAAGTGTASSRSVTTPAGTVTGARFPGDPNPKVNGGRLYWGESHGLNADPAATESGTGTTIGNRHRYWSNISDLAVPGGPIATAVLDDHTHNRLPLVSWHVPGANWAGAANGALDAQVDAWIAWCEARAKPVYWVVNHEPADDGYPAADFRAWMQHIRARITVWEQANGARRRLVFLGCFTDFTFYSNSNGGMAAWWPGDGVFDVCGVDHYVDTNGVPASGPGTSLLGPMWTASVNFLTTHHCPIFVTEWGVRHDNPLGAQIMQEFYDYCTSGTVDVVGMSYFDTFSAWTLTDNNGMLSKFRALMTASDSIHMSDLGY